MKQEEEKWVSALRNSLTDYSEPPVADGWENLVRELSPAPVAPPKRSYFMYTAAAAVILLLIISATTIFLLRNSSTEMMKSAQAPLEMEQPSSGKALKAGVNPLINQSQEKENALALNSSDKRSVTKTRKANVSEPEATAIVVKETEISETEDASEANRPEAKEEKREETTDNGQKEMDYKEQPQQKSRRIAKGSTERIREANDYSAKNNGGDLAIAMYTGNGFGSSHSTNYLALESPRVFSNSFNTLAYYRNALPIEWNHKQPITFGLSIRKRLAGHLAVESGVAYTRLESNAINRNGGSLTYKQTLHYVGIPMKLNYLMLDKRYVTLYLSGGGMVEKSVSGRTESETIISGSQINKTTEKLNVKPLQWSINGAVGVQLNANRQFGVFVEPGVVYYFDDGSNVETIRKENPFNINLQVGIRMSY